MDLKVLSGENFSGRSSYLRERVGLPTKAGDSISRLRDAYVGPDPLDSLSGLALTVSAEFELAAADAEALAAILSAIEEIGFGYLLPRNPFTLSGGEQAVVAILAAAAARPGRLAIDCLLEQLAAPTRRLLLNWLEQWDGELIIADNRLDEWYEGPAEHLTASDRAPLLSPLTPTHPPPSSPELEIKGLRFQYRNGPLVFNQLNLTLKAGITYRLRGANGAGKSTLSKILCGLIKPDGGEILVDGKLSEPWRNPGSLVSYHFQNPSYQLFSRSVAGELARARNPLASARRFGLDGMLEEHPLDLPFVLRKRIALAAAIERAAPLLILDEPTLGQDFRACQAVKSITAGRGGLLITHSEQSWSQETIYL